MRSKTLAIPELTSTFTALAQAKYLEEQSAARQIQSISVLNGEQGLRADAMGHLLSQKLRIARQSLGGLDSLLAQYPLSSPAGRALLQLAEGVLRIPDHYQLDLFIQEQLHSANWHDHRGNSPSWLINWATLGLDWADHLHSPALSPLIREAVKKALKILAGQFIMADDIAIALSKQDVDFRYSFDMLGEAALNREEAENYTERYRSAIHHVGQYSQGAGQFGPSVSVKLSALHPKFDTLHDEQIQAELYPRLLDLALLAKHYDIGLTVDAEESARQLLTLKLFDRLMREPQLIAWSGLGIAIQAYQKNALHIVKWLCQHTREYHRAISVRLVKGAYWDSEIKSAQLAGLSQYPVWTNKTLTDQAYLACAQVLLQANHRIYPQFATHNAFTICAIYQMAGLQNYEFQALYGMGETVYRLANELGIERPCRLYAPIGDQTQLLPYLVRRFLENGASSSFVHQIQSSTSTEATPTKLLAPNRIFSPRLTPQLFDVGDYLHLKQLAEKLTTLNEHRYIATTKKNINQQSNTLIAVNPADKNQQIGQYTESDFSAIEDAFAAAICAAENWEKLDISLRINLIEKLASELEASSITLINLLIREAGKTLINAQSELREAIDFCRYYAAQAKANWANNPPQAIGVIVAISPWNFPLAIFIGQISSALLAGNVVIAKPAPETPLIAYEAIQACYRAGIPSDVLQLLLGGTAIGAALTYDHRCHGVSFTGSLATARKIRSAMAEFGANGVLVAETGGINAMIVDSSAQADQALRDIISSAFDSAGQRCSALRLLCVQDTIADELIQRLKLCMLDLVVGDPYCFSTDIGPVISAKAERSIQVAINTYRRLGYDVFQTRLPIECQQGHFIAPTLIELPTLAALGEEIFGPVLCVYRYKATELSDLINHLNQLGYGLTLGIHSRINRHIQQIIQHTQIGNYYINRNQIGAVVGSQPFGGQNKSGTGPKAGGPWALFRMVKNSDPCQPHYQALPALFEQLRQIVHLWPDLDQAVDLEILLEDAARRSPLSQKLSLPSITGEHNELCYRGRGRIACLGPSDWDLIQQVVIAVITGNQAIIANAELFQQWQRYLGHQYLVFSSDPMHCHINAALAHPSIAEVIEKQLAQIDGAIIQLIQPYEDGKWPLFRLVAEYTITTNTAASGGDIQLLAQ
ncbi:bifunctional proline dehydrogenase/L-glutamate gamma-semialdehyde dehydrogenase PutA [Chitinibacter sp. SCUT-21]|uniref:bifunctional proline dehydrogenase/L-glutamate gamma-semialdehyde dehydrogenase PutA n=1 Tax=Chitinibacter sp. SCUT-21 TaxID=2970891 RepID=UPI0035A6E88A